MSIKSNAFGRVELSGDDAKKFRAQATYGRVKEVAKRNAQSGAIIARELKKSGSFRIKLKESV